MLDTIVNVLYGIGAVAGFLAALVGAVWALFRLFADRWLQARFGQRLEALKHEQQQELEQLKFRINTLMDRTVKLHQREFDVLPEAWGRLTETFTIIHPVALGFLSIPNLNAMSGERLEAVLKENPLQDFEKNELRAATDKNAYYSKAMAWHKVTEARRAYWEFHNYLWKNGIFIPEALKVKFDELDLILRDAMFERQFAAEYGETHRFEKGIIVHEKGPALMKALEQDVQGRLWNTKALDV